MHGDADQLAAAFLAFARVNSRSHIEGNPAQALADSQRAPNGPGRAVESDEEAVAGGIHLAAAEPADLPADYCVVLGQQLAPAVVAELSRPPGRADDVGEKHCGQAAPAHPDTTRRTTHSGAPQTAMLATIGLPPRRAARRALTTVSAVPPAGGRPPRDRANPRANVDGLQATLSYARRLSRLVKCPLSDAEPHSATPGTLLGVKGSLVQSGRPDC